MTRMDSSASTRRKSRCCSLMLVRLFPTMECLPCLLAAVDANAASDFALDISAASGPPTPAAVIQVLVIGAGWFKGRHHHTGIRMMAGFRHQIPLRKILEDFRQV